MSGFTPALALVERPARRSPERRARRFLDVLLLAGAVGFVALATLGGTGPSAIDAGAPAVVAASVH